MSERDELDEQIDRLWQNACNRMAVASMVFALPHGTLGMAKGVFEPLYESLATLISAADQIPQQEVKAVTPAGEYVDIAAEATARRFTTPDDLSSLDETPPED